MPSYSGTFTLPAQMQAKAAGTWTAPPDAPTSVVATGGDAQASVAFTAPAFTGVPAGVTGYTVTSSPGSLTGTGASSPIIVTGLTNATAYTFTVTATGASGVGSPSAASNSVTPVDPPPTVIGQAYGGGFYAGQIGVSNVATHYLIVGPLASAQSEKQYKTSNTTTAGTTSTIDGPANSAAMNNSEHPAAQFCKAVSVGGYTDWYMPAKLEVEICYYRLKPTTASSNTSSGVNLNAIPARPNNYAYTSPPPAQTTATAFQSGNTQAFTGTGEQYWSSSAQTGSTSYVQIFNNGNQYTNLKTSSKRVRAIRRVAV